jgi:hypothetical protein
VDVVQERIFEKTPAHAESWVRRWWPILFPGHTVTTSIQYVSDHQFLVYYDGLVVGFQSKPPNWRRYLPTHLNLIVDKNGWDGCQLRQNKHPSGCIGAKPPY